MHRIDGPGATVDNRFTDGDPIGGVQATMVTDDWANDVQEELMSILAAGGVTPVKGTQDQVLSALTTLIRTQGFTAFTTAGTAPAFTLTPSPAIDAYAPNQRFSVKFNAAAPTSGTLNVSGKGAKNLKQYDSTGAKIATVIAANQVTDVVYDGTDFVVLDPIPSSAVLPYNYFSGFLLANNTAVPTTTIDVGVGVARDTTDSVSIKLSSTIRGVLQASGSWAAGDNQNKLDTGAKAINSWYHVFAIRKTSDGAGDILFSLSATAPIMPSGYAGFRRISSIRTDASGNIIPFINFGRLFTFLTPIADFTASVTSSVLVTLSVPTGVNVTARFWVAAYGSGDAGVVWTSPSANSITFTTTNNATYAGGLGIGTTSADTAGSGAECIAENAQVRFNGFATARVLTYGWEEIA